MSPSKKRRKNKIRFQKLFDLKNATSAIVMETARSNRETARRAGRQGITPEMVMKRGLENSGQRLSNKEFILARAIFITTAAEKKRVEQEARAAQKAERDKAFRVRQDQALLAFAAK